MSKEQEYNQNLVSTNDETYEALVFHFNQIGKTHKNRLLPWIDEELNECCFITFDFDEWLKRTVCYFSFIECSHDDLINYVNQLKDYVYGFSLSNNAMFEGKPFGVKYHKEYAFDGILEHMKQVSQNNKMVFLHKVHKILPLPEDWTLIENGRKVPYEEREKEEYYEVVYGVVND